MTAAMRAVAAWTGPVLLGALAMRVSSGAADAPLLVLAAIVAPLVALVQPRTPESPHLVSAAAMTVTATLVLAASLVPLGDAALLLGARRWHGVVLAAALALLLTVRPHGGAAWRLIALAVGGSALVLALVAVGSATGRAPWDAWRAVAARPALVFGTDSPWVREGGWFARRTTLAFDEAHRLVVITPGTFRVLEQDGPRRVVRDWRLEAGDPLSVRPGDRVAVEAGTRLRFEVGKRVPGAVPSGAVWAEAGAAPLVTSTATLGTLLLGALGLVPASDRRGVAAALLLVVLALAAACWGVYAVAAVPDAALGGSLAEPLLRLPGAVPGGRVLVPLMALAMLALFVAAAGSLHARVTTLAGARGAPLWVGAVAVAALGSVFPFDPWFLLMAGLGFAAATIGAPRLAAAGAARIGSWPVEAVGALAGGLVFVLVVALGPRLPALLGAAAESPAVMAAPAGWLAVKMLRWSGLA
jgi:hypothetical protein